MAKVNVSLPQGTRDFGAETLRKRYHIIDTIKSVFELYGFQPLETPAMENLETLLGKYGEEGDKLIFKILNNGLDQPGKQVQAKEDFEKILEGKNAYSITERALKYDLTIPFARYVAMNQGRLTLPYKRYQVQPVWRADRPQRGRYREFYQCDADVVGSYSLLNDAELAILYAQVFQKLQVQVEIKINHRKLLTALAENCGGQDKLQAITVAMDKLDKTGAEKVMAELAARGLTNEQTGQIEAYLKITGDNHQILDQLKNLLGNHAPAQKAIEDLEFLLSFIRETTKPEKYASLRIDPSLARGLDYYTGVIFEVKATGIQMGSIGGGGRYDDLTGLFGVPGIPGVGISFGIDRIFDVMEELKLFPASVQTGTRVLFFNLGEAESRAAFAHMQRCRDRGISCELYPENVKFDRQFKYAEKRNIPFAVIIGEQELAAESCVVKDLVTGNQQRISLSSLVSFPFSSI